jgi:hypothetical protein
MNGADALGIALDLYRRPQRAHALRRHGVPKGMLDVIKIAASSDEEVEVLAGAKTDGDVQVREAAIFFLQQMLMPEDGDDHRQLGLEPGASLQDVKDHKRWLLKWLHPDRNPNAWEQVLFRRVTTAAERLEAAIRSGEGGVLPIERRKRARRRKSMAWQAAHVRTKQAIDWRPRLKKAALAAIVFVVIVGAAQAVLSASQGQGLKASWAQIVTFD